MTWPLTSVDGWVESFIHREACAFAYAELLLMYGPDWHGFEFVDAAIGRRWPWPESLNSIKRFAYKIAANEVKVGKWWEEED